MGDSSIDKRDVPKARMPLKAERYDEAEYHKGSQAGEMHEEKKGTIVGNIFRGIADIPSKFAEDLKGGSQGDTQWGVSAGRGRLGHNRGGLSFFVSGNTNSGGNKRGGIGSFATNREEPVWTPESTGYFRHTDHGGYNLFDRPTLNIAKGNTSIYEKGDVRTAFLSGYQHTLSEADKVRSQNEFRSRSLGSDAENIDPKSLIAKQELFKDIFESSMLHAINNPSEYESNMPTRTAALEYQKEIGLSSNVQSFSKAELDKLMLAYGQAVYSKDGVEKLTALYKNPPVNLTYHLDQLTYKSRQEVAKELDTPAEKALHESLATMKFADQNANSAVYALVNNPSVWSDVGNGVVTDTDKGPYTGVFVGKSGKLVLRVSDGTESKDVVIPQKSLETVLSKINAASVGDLDKDLDAKGNLNVALELLKSDAGLFPDSEKTGAALKLVTGSLGKIDAAEKDVNSKNKNAETVQTQTEEVKKEAVATIESTKAKLGAVETEIKTITAQRDKAVNALEKLQPKHNELKEEYREALQNAKEFYAKQEKPSIREIIFGKGEKEFDKDRVESVADARKKAFEENESEYNEAKGQIKSLAEKLVGKLAEKGNLEKDISKFQAEITNADELAKKAAEEAKAAKEELAKFNPETEVEAKAGAVGSGATPDEKSVAFANSVVDGVAALKDDLTPEGINKIRNDSIELSGKILAANDPAEKESIVKSALEKMREEAKGDKATGKKDQTFQVNLMINLVVRPAVIKNGIMPREEAERLIVEADTSQYKEGAHGSGLDQNFNPRGSDSSLIMS